MTRTRSRPLGIGSGEDEPVARICGTCPWLRENHGKAHPAGWYTTRNLVRLWNGLRRGDAPGMLCHSSDERAPDYGATVAPKRGTPKRQCAGALGLVIRHVQEANDTIAAGAALVDYQCRHDRPLTKDGLAAWITRHLFGMLPAVDSYRQDDVGLPWDRTPRGAEPKSSETERKATMSNDPTIPAENAVRRLLNLDTKTVARILDRDGTLSPVDALRRVDFNVARDIAQALVDERLVIPASGNDDAGALQ